MGVIFAIPDGPMRSNIVLTMATALSPWPQCCDLYSPPPNDVSRKYSRAASWFLSVSLSFELAFMIAYLGCIVMRGTPKWDRRVLDSSMIDVKNSEHQWKFQIRHELSSYGRETLFSIFSIGMGEEFNHGEQNSYERGRGACFSLCISAWWIGAVYHIISGSARTVVWRKNTAAFGEQTNTRALCLGSHLSKQGGRKKSETWSTIDNRSARYVNAMLPSAVWFVD